MWSEDRWLSNQLICLYMTAIICYMFSLLIQASDSYRVPYNWYTCNNFNISTVYNLSITLQVHGTICFIRKTINVQVQESIQMLDLIMRLGPKTWKLSSSWNVGTNRMTKLSPYSDVMFCHYKQITIFTNQVKAKTIVSKLCTEKHRWLHNDT